MAIGIYGIFNKSNDDCLYVGQTLDINLRWKQHLKLLKSKKHPRKDLVEWYHNDNNSNLIDFRILEKCKKDELNSFEIKWFNLLLPKYYGKKPSDKEIWEHSDETKNKISESLRKKYYAKICLKCNKDFYAITDDKIMCQKCRKSHNNSYIPIELKCINCNKEFSGNGNRKYCSKECRLSFHNSRCKNCSKLIDEKSKYCSKECYKKLKDSSIPLSFDELHKMYVLDKLSTRTIASKTGYSNVSIQNWLRKYGIRVKGNHETNKDLALEKFKKEIPEKSDLLFYYEQGLSYSEIAKIFSSNRDRVSEWCKYYNFSPRLRTRKIL